MDGPEDRSSESRDSACAKPLLPAEVNDLYDRYAAVVQAFLIGVLRDLDLAAEALQNTFRRLLESGHTARRESIKGWLFKVAYHEAMALRRRAAVDGRALSRYGAFWASRSEPETAASPQEQQVISSEDVIRLRQALGELPAEQRWGVERRIYHEETFAVIAAELGVPLGTVLTRMRLAMQQLERSLKRE